MVVLGENVMQSWQSYNMARCRTDENLETVISQCFFIQRKDSR